MIDFCNLRKLINDLSKIDEELKAEQGLSFSQASLLCAISMGFGEPGVLSKEVGLSPSRTTRILDFLEKEGFIERSINEHSRRNVDVRLTAKGKLVKENLNSSKITLPDYIERIICEENK